MANLFAPVDLDCSDFEQLEPLYQQLLDRDIDSLQTLEDWLADYSDFACVVSEYGSRRQIEHSCHTDDEAIEKRYLQFVGEIIPKIKPLDFACQKKMLACGHVDALAQTAPKYRQLVRQWETEVALYREENIPLQTQITQLTTQYGKLCGDMLVEFQGKQLTLQQLARFGEQTDRQVRQDAWELAASRRLQDRKAMDDVFDEMFALRAKMAQNADLADYRQYTWQAMERFDYTPEACLNFADAIEEVCVPRVVELDRQRQADLGVDSLRPWDLAVDPKGRSPLNPFDAQRPMDMVAGVGKIFEKVSPELAEQFSQLKPERNLDLGSRPGKRPGGYQSSLEQVRQPFIFMNAAGSHRDVETLLHEAGHAFHYMEACEEPLMFARHAPLEFCEVASMSMELIGCDYLDVFYDAADAARAKAQQFEGILRFFPWMATIDGFQQKLYTTQRTDAQTRTATWLEVYNRFSSGVVDWTGHEASHEARWHAQLHIFHYPFYYVEYGIAQLGALQIWQQFKQDPQTTLKNLRRAFALGGSRPLPELFDVAGIQFDFTVETLGPLIEAVQQELNTLS